MSFIKIVQPKVSRQDKNMFSTKLINVLIAINMKSKQYKVYNLWETLINIYIYKI